MEHGLYNTFLELQGKHWWFCGRKEIILSVFEKYTDNNPKKVLDAGCGCGVMLDSLKKYGMVFGIDSSDEAIEYCKRISDAEVKKGTIPEDIPFEANAFDAVFALDILEHTENDAASIAALAAVLRPGGTIVVTVPAYNFLWSAHDDMNHHKRRYLAKDVRDKIEASGFQVHFLSYYNTLLFLPIFLARFFKGKISHSNRPDLGMPPPMINNVLKKLFCMEKHLLKHCRLGFGVSVLAVASKR